HQVNSTITTKTPLIIQNATYDSLWPVFWKSNAILALHLDMTGDWKNITYYPRSSRIHVLYVSMFVTYLVLYASTYFTYPSSSRIHVLYVSLYFTYPRTSSIDVL